VRDYYIENKKFVSSNPAYLLTYKYTDPDVGSVNGITLVFTWGSFVYHMTLLSKPELTSELWPTFEQMFSTFSGGFGVGDRVIDNNSNGEITMC
jgi:hypothetical protein